MKRQSRVKKKKKKKIQESKKFHSAHILLNLSKSLNVSSLTGGPESLSVSALNAHSYD